jgi:IS5 family transposase
MMTNAPGFFDFDDRLRRLSNLGDPFEAYGRLVDFEAFRPERDKAFARSSGAHAVVRLLIP